MNIVILSRNANLYSTQRLVEEAEKRNHDIEVIDPLKCDIIIGVTYSMKLWTCFFI